MNWQQLFVAFSFGSFLVGSALHAQQQQPAVEGKQAGEQPPVFRWVNPLSSSEQQKYPRLQHATFRSDSMGVAVGYCIYLPPQYEQQSGARFPVVYYLHGGRPGSEKKSIGLVPLIDEHIRSGDVPPMIYVFVNGGPVSHYNMPNDPGAQGADVFIRELIPHIDQTYRTIADRSGRAIEGFSQGGRGTARLMFRYPQLFCSASPGGGGYSTEKRISESGGAESETLVFAAGDNTWDLARDYAGGIRSGTVPHPLRILVHVGDKGFNYQNNLDWMQHLRSLGIEHEQEIVPGAEHSARQIYEHSGVRIMLFHATSFGRVADLR